MIEIPVLVTSVWAVLQPFLPIIATKAAEEIGKTSVSKIWSAIEKKFKSKDTTSEILSDFLKNPQDSDVQGAFRLQLKKILEEDSAFASDLAKLLESAKSDFKGQVNGNGALAQGDGSVAVGQGGAYFGGNITGSNIITGNNNKIISDEKKEQ